MKHKNEMELLAPAGSTDSFHAAIEAGANAIYLGVGDLNARVRATNFDTRMLSKLIPYGHTHNVKTYVTINTLIKQNELRNVIDLLYQLEQIGTDAIIVQDLGIAYLAKKYFPGLSVHASTQMVIHNSLGVSYAQKNGISRAILARELSINEMRTIQNTVPNMELEIFIHGALCVALSGLCLASSYLGGSSGNRGRCTQVCRRRFTAEDSNKGGFYFSPKDFWAIDFLEEFRDIGIKSLKIEGRMRSAEYVHTVVGAYRKALDKSASLDEIKEELQTDFGREKTSFFLDSERPRHVFNAQRPLGTGIKLGVIEKIKDNCLYLTAQETVSAGDQVRLHGLDGMKGRSFKVLEVSEEKSLLKIRYPENSDADPIVKDTVYITSKKEREFVFKGKVNTKSIPFRYTFPETGKVLKKLSTKIVKTHTPTVYLKYNNPDWLPLIDKAGPHYIPVFQCERPSAEFLLNNPHILSKYAEKLIISFPPFITENDVPFWKDAVKKLSKKGINKWMGGNPGIRELVPQKDHLIADYTMWNINKAAHKALKVAGWSQTSYSVEDDIVNLKPCSSSNTLFTLFSYIPAFITRVKPATKDNTYITDSQGDGFFTQTFNDNHYLMGEKPICLFHRRDKLMDLGISHFVIDFSFCPPERELLKTVLSHFKKKKRLENTTLFNHKGGLK